MISPEGIEVRTGGVPAGRALDPEDALEGAIAEAFAERLSWCDEEFGQQLWSSLTNTVWIGEAGERVLFTFRAAGDVVAALACEGDYLDWYCSSPAGCVDPDIAAELSRRGWRHEPA